MPLENFNPKEESEKERLYRIMETAALFFQMNLKDNQQVLDYIRGRGLTDETIKNFRIGFVKNDWRELYSHLVSKGWKDADIEKAGLAKKSDKPGLGDSLRFYDRFRGRIMFPIADSSGRVIAFSGRIFEDDGKSAKYLNSPDTPIFQKSMVLYGLDRAKESIRKNNFSILVEGQMDLVLSHQAGYKNTVATSGTALSDATVSKENLVSNLGLVRRLSTNIVIAFDADRAGFEASGRAARIALSLGMDVKVAKMPEGIDPADLISKTGPDAWRDAVKNSKHIIEFVLDKVMHTSAGDMRRAGRDIKEKVLPYVDALESAIEKAHFIKKISDASNIPEAALKDDLARVERESVREKKEVSNILEKEADTGRRGYIEHRLLGIILWQKSLETPRVDAAAMLERLGKILGSDAATVLAKVEDAKEDLIFEAEVFYGKDEKIDRDAEELLGNLEEEYAKEELLRKMQELNIVEATGDRTRVLGIVGEINELNKKIQDIKNSRSKKMIIMNPVRNSTNGTQNDKNY